MKHLITTFVTITLTASFSHHAAAQGAKPGNCAILAEMSAKTVKKDSRFKDHKDIAPALMKFAEAQEAKMKAGMADTYKQSEAFGWDKAKVDKMMKDNEQWLRLFGGKSPTPVDV